MAGRVTKNKASVAKEQKRRRSTRIIIGIVMLLAAAALVVGGILLYQREQKNKNTAPDASSYEKVLGSYYSAILSADGKAMSQVMAPPEYWTYYMETYEKTENDVINTFSEGCNATLKEWQDTYGTDVKVSYQIEGMSQQGDEGVQEWNSDMEATLGNTGASITEAVTLEVKLSYHGSVKSGTETMYPTLGKIGDNWYIIAEDSEELKSES